MFRPVRVLLIILPLLLSACYSFHYSEAAKPQPPAAGADEIAYFAYNKTLTEAPRFANKIEDRGKYVIREMKIKVKDFPELKNKYLKAYVWEHKDTSVKRPALLVLPPTGGPYDLVKIFGNYFADRGFAVVGLRRREEFFNPKKPMAYNQDLIRQAVIDARRSIDYLETREDVDKDRIVLMGISLGGITGALTMESDGRVKAAGLMVTAGHLDEILTTTGFRRVQKFRNAMEKEFNATPDQLKGALASSLAPIDPVTYAGRLDPARVIMINGAFDDVILRNVVMKTHASYGNPDQYFIPAGHYTSIGFCGYGNGKIYDHFVKVLKLDPATMK